MKWRGLAVAVPLAGAIAAFSGIGAPSKAAVASGSRAVVAAVPAPVIGAGHAKSLVLNSAGSKLKPWNQTASYCATNPGFAANGTVATDSGGNIKLTTPGKSGSCVALISPGSYSSGVIEAKVNLPALAGKPGTIANWTGIWLSGETWPTDGELDAVEVEPVDATNAVTWHSGTAESPFVASTSGYFPTKLATKTANLTPGWHTVDIVYRKGYFGIFYDGKLYTSYTSANVTGRPQKIYITMSDTPNNSWVTERIGGAPTNSASAAATLTVQYLRVWSYK